MAGALLDFFAEYGRHHDMQAFTVFDAGVPYYLLHPERFTQKIGRISIVCSGQTTRGQTVFTEDPTGAVKVLLQTDPRLFSRELMNSIHTVSEKEKENEAHGS
jgi:inosine-uridine nucleoside N-ribohydrolase